MKTMRKSHSTENRNARKELLARGVHPLVAMLPPLHTRPDRRWRRANRHLLVNAPPSDILQLQPDGSYRPSGSILGVDMDERTRTALGPDVS